MQNPPQDAIHSTSKSKAIITKIPKKKPRSDQKAKETIRVTEISESKERNYKRRKESEPGTLPGNAHVKIWGELSLVKKT